MLTLRVTEDLSKLTQAIGDVGARHIPRSTVIALTRSTVTAKTDLVAEMSRAFDRPTPFTLNSLFMRPATFALPQAEIMVKDFAPKGTPAIKYLAPEIYGGERRIKRFERALQAAGLLPPGMYAIPGSAVPLDAYGNVSGPYITRMLSQLRAFSETGYRANETARGKARRLTKDRRKGDWLVLTERRGKLLPGIYQRYHFGHGNTVKPIFIFTRKAPRYRERFRFHEIVQQTVAREFAGEFIKAWGEAVQRFGA